jgi:GH15 family glucan-1,4-alpha-glucosidase
MPSRIEDYALIGDCETAALVSKDGSIDWLCWPRFDSGACFAALLGDANNGHWRITPAAGAQANVRRTRRYRRDTLILETELTTADGSGAAVLIDFMPLRGERAASHLVRLVVGMRGSVPMRTELIVRFGYGGWVPWVTRNEAGHLLAIAGPDMLLLRTPVELRGEGLTTIGDFVVSAGQRVPFVLTYASSHLPIPEPIDAEEALRSTEEFWQSWGSTCRSPEQHAEIVTRSLITLKALTYAPTGGIVAAPTTSLPEQLGGPRNWDYRFTWVRDASYSVGALLALGFTEEPYAFMTWLRDRIEEQVGTSSGPLKIMYRVDGSSDLIEETLDHLAGYKNSRPVRIGNGAADQLQLDIYGEAIFALRQVGSHAPIGNRGWQDIRRIMDWLVDNWDQPDEGIWETRGGRRDFTYGRVMTWVALDGAIRAAQELGRPADLARWTAARDAVYNQVLDRGWNADRRAFVQYRGTDVMDASLLAMPLTGFIVPSDPMWLSTLDAMEEELVSDSLVYRYNPSASPDGLAGNEGTFSICTFWYVDALARSGRLDKARYCFEKMLTYANHVGLYSEEIGSTGEQLGNFPQAFSHLSLIGAAVQLNEALDRAESATAR